MESYKTQIEELKRTKKIELNNFTTVNIERMAQDLLNNDIVKKGITINGWKFLESHELIEGMCLYNGEKFRSLYKRSHGASFLFKKYPDLKNEYIDKVKIQLQEGTYDRELFAKHIEISLEETIICWFKSKFPKK